MERMKYSIKGILSFYKIMVLTVMCVIFSFSALAQSDGFEPDNSKSDAKVQAVNTVSSNRTISPAEDHDWISFTISTTQNIMIEVPRGREEVTILCGQKFLAEVKQNVGFWIQVI